MRETARKHGAILNELLQQLEPVDLQLMAYPEVIQLRQDLVNADAESKNQGGSFKTTVSGSAALKRAEELKVQISKCKPTLKDWRVYGVQHLLNLCRTNNWQLAAQHGRVYVFNGEYWRSVDEADLKRFLGKAFERIGLKHVDSEDFKYRDELVKQFHSTAHLPAPDRDRCRVTVNLQNGTLDVSQKAVQLREFNPSDFLTYQLPFFYDPQAVAPVWTEFLETVLPDKDVQRVLAEAAATAFLSASVLKLEKVPVLFGSGANGKSVFADVLTAVLGRENVSGHSLKQLTQNDNARASLQDKLLNISSEIGGIADSDTFKLLASGEPVSAKLLYKDVYTMRDYARLFCNANELPREVENNHSFFRRFLILPFSVTITTEKQNPQLAGQIIATELPGVLNWILSGLDRLLTQRRFSHCKAAEDALKQYQHESNTVAQWLEDAGYRQSTNGHEQPAKTLYTEYREYCKEAGFRSVSSKTFAHRMEGAGFEKDRKRSGMVYYAVKSFQMITAEGSFDRF